MEPRGGELSSLRHRANSEKLITEEVGKGDGVVYQYCAPYPFYLILLNLVELI